MSFSYLFSALIIDEMYLTRVKVSVFFVVLRICFTYNFIRFVATLPFPAASSAVVGRKTFKALVVKCVPIHPDMCRIAAGIFLSFT